MKGTRFVNNQIVTTEDLNAIDLSKSQAIGQLGYDLLKSQTAYHNGIGTGVIVKGVIKDSGMTSSHISDPLKVYLDNSLNINLSIYSGIAYAINSDNRVERIFVPNLPDDVPLNDIAAASNYDNIDMITETQTREFTTGIRPPRTNLKQGGFGTGDASGTWYCCIKYVTGTYDSTTIPSDGSVEDTKTYDSYEIRVSQLTAAQLHASDSSSWLPLATLDWNGVALTITSHDRLYCSCTTNVEDELIVQHQTRLHSNSIISTDHTLFTMTVSGIQVVLPNIVFSSANEGVLINGSLIQNIGSSIIQFDVTMPSGNYYLYIDNNGTPRATVNISTATLYCILGSCYFSNVGAGKITLNSSSTDQIVRDRRTFGSIGEYQLASTILGENYSYLDDLKIKQLSDELISHRDNNHGNGLWLASNSAPYAKGAGSLGATSNGTIVTIKDIGSGDKLYLDGWECTKISGTKVIDPGAGTYIIYAYRSGIEYDNHEFKIASIGGATTVADNRYPICKTVDGTITDMRVYGTVGYWHTQINSNINNLNTLPQPMVCMWGTIPVTAFGFTSDIYLRDDWSGTHSLAYYAGGGTSTGKQVFAQIPSITLYIWDGTWSAWKQEYYDGTGNASSINIAIFDATRFRIYNNTGTAVQTFRWIAIGPSAVQGKDNPYY